MRAAQAMPGPSHAAAWRDPWRAWGVPADAALAALILYLAGGNEALFLLLNDISVGTGEPLWSNLTVLGDTLVVLTCVIPFLGRRPDIVRALLIVALFAAVSSHGLKALLDVARPPAVLGAEMLRVIGPAHRTGAFPSGHTTSAFALAGLLCLHLNGRAWQLPLVGAAWLVGVSRVVVGVHWPLDVLAGAVVGWSSAVLGARVAARWPGGLQPAVQLGAGIVLIACAATLLLLHDTGYPQARFTQRLLGAAGLLFGLVWLARRPWRRGTAQGATQP